MTALAIAKELDIYREGNTVISGEELDTMTDDELDDAVKTTTVCSLLRMVAART